MRIQRRYAVRSLQALAAALLVACGGEAPQDAQAAQQAAQQAAPAPPALGDVESLGVRNAAMPAPNLLTAGQVTEAQLAQLVAMGYTNFVSLRVPTEDGAGWEETHDLADGVRFNRIPVAGSGGLTRENVMALDRILDEAGAENSVVYCASSNRVGGLLALRAYWLDGADPEDALALGRGAGLRSLEPAVLELLSQPR